MRMRKSPVRSAPKACNCGRTLSRHASYPPVIHSVLAPKSATHSNQRLLEDLLEVHGHRFTENAAGLSSSRSQKSQCGELNRAFSPRENRNVHTNATICSPQFSNGLTQNVPASRNLIPLFVQKFAAECISQPKRRKVADDADPRSDARLRGFSARTSRTDSSTDPMKFNALFSQCRNTLHSYPRIVYLLLKASIGV